ncbi:helix-turn-helix domain-containing protein [Pseudoxanthomonas koreensis]|uniref:helix-turn-helix domain-containing protein n=1 Tax=Pseudoxanthomonas koreensis TaxID=266061 RepID=UPI001390D2DF|nr:helix-turn-helix transcriptional regulator [Pseudoxanthomonas koreensis]KAF1692681.1 hypothetical protein CSC64_06755 [Pseudoxanthomonas koreensis]
MDLRTYRTNKGLSQVELAAQLSRYGRPVSQSRVSQWENGQLGYTPEWATQIERGTSGEVCRVGLIFGPAPGQPKENANA